MKRILYFLPYVVVFLNSFFQPYDTDLGWHLKYGEFFVKNHEILKTNTFSSLMPDYNWNNSSWLTDVISYLTFSQLGFLGLSVFAAVVITATFYFFSKASKLSLFEEAIIFPITLHFMHPLNMVSFRGQLLSLMFIGLLYLILTKFEDTKSRIIFLTIPLFIIWSNVHGQFLLGLAIFSLWFIGFLIKQLKGIKSISTIISSKENIKIFSLITTCMFAVLINPFGLGVYHEALRHFSNPLQKYVLEWLPYEEQSLFWWNQIIAGFIAMFGIVFVVFSSKLKENSTGIGLFSIFYILAFWVRRYSWPMYYFAMSAYKPFISFLKPENKKNEIIAAVFILITYISFVFVIDSPLARIKSLSWESYCKFSSACPQGALDYLISNNIQGELLTMYDWGGFIIWRYPLVKPTIDGRMHLWKDENGYSAFEEYFNIEQNVTPVESTKYNLALVSTKKPIFKRLTNLKEANKWQLLYSDDISAVFKKN